MCRALKVICVAEDADSLRELKMASVGAAWELSPGATTAAEALDQLGEGRAHFMVAFGEWEELITDARARYPGLRVVADRAGLDVDIVVASLDGIRDAIVGAPTPGGPVRGADPAS